MGIGRDHYKGIPKRVSEVDVTNDTLTAEIDNTPLDVNVQNSTLSVDASGSTVPVDASGTTVPVAVQNSTLPVDVQNVILPIQLVSVGDGPHLDAFGRHRQSQPYTLFDSTHENGKNPLLWDESLVSGGTSTHVANEAAIKLAVGTTSGAKVIRQTKQYFKYQPGKSHNPMLTGVFAPGKVNLRQRIGYFDVNNGLFFQLLGTEVSVVRRSYVTGSAVDTPASQSQWNIDKMDGTGISGKNLDFTKAQIFFIDLEWLGVGRVRMGFVVGGQVYYCHEFLHANTVTSVYMSTATLPCRYEIENIGTTSDASEMKQICTTVVSEGGYNPRGIIRGVDRGNSPVSISANNYEPVISIRLKAGFNRATLIPLTYTLFSQSNDDILINLVLNGDLTDAAFSSVGANSIAEYDLDATAVSGGEIIWSDYTSERAGGALNDVASLESALVLAANIAGDVDTLTLAAQPLGTSSIYGALNFKEIY